MFHITPKDRKLLNNIVFVNLLAIFASLFLSMLVSPNLLLQILIYILFFIILEIFLRIYSLFARYYVLPPNLTWIQQPIPDSMYGIPYEQFTYSTKKNGIRGSEYIANKKYNIMAVGGSMTHCVYLDDSKSWPYLVEKNYNNNFLGKPLWVGNTGMSGHSIVHNIYALKYFIPQYDIDAVIIVVGINEFIPYIRNVNSFPLRYTGKADLRILKQSFSMRPLVDRELSTVFRANMALWHFINTNCLYVPKSYRIRSDNKAGKAYIQRREKVFKAKNEIDILPNIDQSLKDYKHNLDQIIEISIKNRIRLIMATHPVLWSSSLSENAEKRLWMGHKVENGKVIARYSSTCLRNGMDRFNMLLIDTCNERQIECIDLSGKMSGDERYFYDDCHVNIDGSYKVANYIGEYLNKSSPLCQHRAVSAV